MNASAAALVLCCGLVLVGCGHSWNDYDMSLYRSMKDSSPQAQEAHAQLLSYLIEQSEQDGCKPPPGICAEYAYYLGKLQKSPQAPEYLAKELTHYPESAIFVQVMQRLMEGAKHVFTTPPAGDVSPSARQRPSAAR